ncbi:MAG: ATP-binding cassette domain-containing protein [Caldimicrobium sp.]|jgi:lipopolysaccharide transport system ATP-binding protein|nr:ATP-binding cassette domain-containing protein [Caldimicrobium sp.]
MQESVVIFERVTKSYPTYTYITGGFKNFLIHLPKSLKGFRKRYTVLREISFQIAKGECVGFIGRNGVGKSTLLGLIAGVLKPDSGKIVVKGRVSPLLELGAGFHPDLTGRENIILNGVLLGMTKAEVKAKLDFIVEFSGLKDFIDQPIRTYSSGMVARLAFSVIAHLDPEILLIDEILAVGDVEFQKKSFQKILEFKEKGITIVLVSHSLDSIEKVCDRAIWLENGGIKMDGEAKEVVSAYLRS